MTDNANKILCITKEHNHIEKLENGELWYLNYIVKRA